MDETDISTPDPDPGPADRHRPAPVREDGALRREIASLRAENIALRELCLDHAKAAQRAAQLRAQLDEILGSRAWAAVRRARRVAAFLVGGGTIGGRCVAALRTLIKRAVRRPRAAGPKSAPAPVDFSSTPLPGGVVPVPDRRGRGLSTRTLKVSVIVPNYNHARYLEERLRSIFRQTLAPHEILFLDDASSDDSVAVARRLAPESPVPFRLILNETNSGSTFRQWLKGIDLASGDLLWIAESDDTCRPELLDRLVPEFADPEVMLAYCQSAMIGPEGQRYTEDYLFATEDLSPTRWRYPYKVPGAEEVERALSQRNTIPNASAVVFRKPAALDDRGDLERLRLGGDWLFYAMRIRDGEIAYVPEPLNGHRHHDRTVRSAFERTAELFEEQLRVKARIFESFPVSANAISCSVARSIVEYVDRTADLDRRPAMTEHPRLVAPLGRLRALSRDRVRSPGDFRVLIVIAGASRAPGPEAMIRLANALAGRFPVFLANALPGVIDPAVLSQVDDRVVPLEGTLGRLPWTWDGDPRRDPAAREALSGRRAEVVRELIAFHRIDVIHSRGWWADRLVAAAGPEPRIPWFIDLRDGDAYRAECRRDPESATIAGRIGSRIHGVFHERPDDLKAFPVCSLAADPGRAIALGDDGEATTADRIAAAYLSAVRAARPIVNEPHLPGSAGRLRREPAPGTTHEREESCHGRS